MRNRFLRQRDISGKATVVYSAKATAEIVTWRNAFPCGAVIGRMRLTGFLRWRIFRAVGSYNMNRKSETLPRARQDV
jgi:hypothetical protein